MERYFGNTLSALFVYIVHDPKKQHSKLFDLGKGNLLFSGSIAFCTSQKERALTRFLGHSFRDYHQEFWFKIWSPLFISLPRIPRASRFFISLHCGTKCGSLYHGFQYFKLHGQRFSLSIFGYAESTFH